MDSTKKIEELFRNQAQIKDAEPIQCGNCDERIIFHLRDSQGRDFTVGLTTMLECIEFAVKEGELPKMPASWCTAVGRAYSLEFDQEAMM